MKNELIQLAKEKEFKSKFFHPEPLKYSDKEPTRYYLWMCELQKWLREIYDFEVLIYCNASGWIWDINRAYSKNNLSGGTGIKWSEESGPNNAGQWETYEEALEAGLLEALKLIKDG